MDTEAGVILNKRMRISVIVPTFNGANKIIATLRSIEKQTISPNEVIVVVDGSTDGTIELIQKQRFNFPKLSIIEQVNGGRAKVRNKGASEATGELLVFFDDDMFVLPDCLERHVQHHNNYSGSLLTGTAIDDLIGLDADFARFKETLSKKWDESLGKDSLVLFNKTNVFLTAANFSIPKQVFFALDGFDLELSDGEDFDIAFRAIMFGYSVYYDPRVKALHRDLTSCRIFVMRTRSYYKAGIELAIRKPELYLERFSSRLNRVLSIKQRLLRVFCSNWWINSVDRNTWTWMPQKMRFKLYDYVVTANSTVFPDLVELK
jgi:glycosyltransferase involved in cell wall biosynthesis